MPLFPLNSINLKYECITSHLIPFWPSGIFYKCLENLKALVNYFGSYTFLRPHLTPFHRKDLWLYRQFMSLLFHLSEASSILRVNITISRFYEIFLPCRLWAQLWATLSSLVKRKSAVIALTIVKDSSPSNAEFYSGWDYTSLLLFSKILNH